MISAFSGAKRLLLESGKGEHKMKLPEMLAFWFAMQFIVAGFTEAQVLTHGPVVGAVTASEAKVFVRTDSAANVALRYGTDSNLQTYAVSNSMTTSEAADFTATILLAGLGPEATYYLDVVVNGVPQFLAPPFPSFTTFPASGSARNFQFVVLTDFDTVSTLKRGVQTFASAAANLPAFVFIGGDFDHSNPKTLADKRQMFKSLYDVKTRFMGDFVSLILRRFPIAHQWDDHDAGLNNLDKTYPDWNLSQQAFQEYTPTYPLPAVSPGIWQKFSYAQAEFFVLDCRSQRDYWLDPEGPDKSMLDGNNLGAIGQLQWLENGLLTSTARWKIIFTSVITNPTTKQNEGWAAYSTEWNALKSFINNNHISGIIFIAGDLHLGAVDNGTQAGFPEMSVTQANETDTGFCASAATGIWSEGYYDDTCAGYGLVSVAQNPDRVTLQVMDEDGVAHITYVVVDGTPTPTPTPPPEPPAITKQPANKRVKVGQTAIFSVTASGTPPLSYQWRKNQIDLPGATRPSYTTPPAGAGDNGAVFAVTVTNSFGAVTSRNARLKVQ